MGVQYCLILYKIRYVETRSFFHKNEQISMETRKIQIYHNASRLRAIFLLAAFTKSKSCPFYTCGLAQWVRPRKYLLRSINLYSESNPISGAIQVI